MNRAKSICRKTGCNVLIDSPGYCNVHQYLFKQHTRESFDNLKRRNTGFYNTQRWHEVSARHRHTEPLCRECKEIGKTTPAVLVHHNPELNELFEQGLNPYDEQYLVSLCTACHNRHLREMQNGKKSNT